MKVYRRMEIELLSFLISTHWIGLSGKLPPPALSAG
jgi:hypothetical protein